MKTNLRGCGIVLAVASIFAARPVPLSAVTPGGQVTLSSAAPATAEPGLTTVRLLGSGFPAGNFNPNNIQVSLAPQGGGASTTVSATQYQAVVGTTSRVTFLLPAAISVAVPTTFSISISDPTDGFSSNNSLAITITPLASIASINPNSGSPGQTVNVTITGLYSHFLSGLTQVSASPGITVGSVNVTSLTSLTARLVIAASAPGGSPTISVSTGGEVESVAFNVKATPVIVPNVVGDTRAVATTAITGVGLVVGTVTTQASSTVPAGNVISQRPVGGTSVSPGSAVNLVISSGPAPVIVPNVVGDTRAVATTAITGVGLVVGTVTTQASSTVPAGNVISQRPVGGTSVSPGSAVNLVISSGPAPVIVPNVVGDTRAVATTAITGVGLVVGTVITQASSTVPAGDVISQSPVGGTSVSPGSAVNLVISSGPAPVIVPNVVGDTRAAATTAITGVGLVVGTVTTQASSTVPAGNVISQSPVGGASVSPGSAVNLVISSGPAPVIVPNVVGDTRAVATTAITGVGLVVGTVTMQASGTVPAGDVISQSPVGGTSVSPGSAVNLVISSGPAPVIVPNVVGDTRAAATTAITGVGLVVGTVTTQASSTVPAGNVISQSPVGGTSVSPGSAVNLVISSGPAPVIVPNVVGDTRAAATTAITGVGLVVGTVTTQASSTVPAGNVISQSPVGGTSVSPGSAVNLVISSGPAPVIVPDVVSDTRAAATTAITGVGLVVGTVTMQASGTVPAGDVISQSPVGGTSVSPGSAVNLVISSGSGQVLVPNVVGDTQAAAATAITNADLVEGTVAFQTSNTVPVGEVISQSPVSGTSVNAGSAVSVVISAQLLTTGLNEAVSNLISVQNGPIGSPSLPTGENEAVSNLISIQNGVIGSPSLPPGKNEAVSNLISVQNGAIGSPSLPGGENEAVSDLISVQNGAIGSLLLPTGKNEAVSNLISAANGAASNATASIKKSGFALTSGNSSGTAEGVLAGSVLTAGETITVTADVPAQISLNDQRAGNDAGSATDLTFVVPEGANSLRIRAGDSADSAVTVQPQTTVLTGQVVDEHGAAASNVQVQLRHAGLEAEFFKLPSNTPAGEAPSIAGLKATAQEPASSLDLHNPAQALGYFPIGAIDAPNFAVRFHGQFLAQTKGSYVFFVAATDGALLSIDGKQQADVRGVKPGLESPVTVQLAAGWHDVELLAYSVSQLAELVVSFAPPGGSKQIVSPTLLRAVSTALTAVTDASGKFTITAPAWLDQVEAIATSGSTSEPHSGVSAVAASGIPGLGQIHLAPGSNF